MTVLESLKLLSGPRRVILTLILAAFVYLLTFSVFFASNYFGKKVTKRVMCIAKDRPNQNYSVDFTNVSDLKQALPNTIIETRDAENTQGRCRRTITGRRILINFAKNCCKVSQPRNCKTGLAVGGFDVCVMFNENSLDGEFLSLNKQLLSQNTGGGYWLWKPYVIMKTLHAMRSNDVLFYADSGSEFIANVDSAHVCLFDRLGLDIGIFSDAHPEHRLTKPDAYVLMGIDRGDARFSDANQVVAAFLLLRNSFRALRFIGEWITYSQDYRIIANDNSKLAANPPDFIGHRNDQSILSLLQKKWRLELLPDPSQWGEKEPGATLRKQERYKLINRTFIRHTRNKS